MANGAFIMQICDGKSRMTQEDAEVKAEYYSRLNRRKVRAYHCAVCSYWHVGKNGSRSGSHRSGRKISARV